jgi:hypothetical protein
MDGHLRGRQYAVSATKPYCAVPGRHPIRADARPGGRDPWLRERGRCPARTRDQHGPGYPGLADSPPPVRCGRICPPGDGAAAIRRALAALAEQPHPDKAVAWGGSGIYRLRLPGIRILYQVDEDAATVYVINVAVTV